MSLTFVVPALLWPRQVMRDVLHGANLPALQTLLGKGRILPSSTLPASTDAWWSHYFGIGTGLAAAPLRLVAAGIDPGDANWICADPVHLRVDRGGATLADPALLNIGPTEARQLHEAVAPLLAPLGELVVATPSQWHLRIDAVSPLPALPDRLDGCIERTGTALLPSGDEGRALRQLLNDIQTTLHAHPVNAQRTERGKATINSIALWGGGSAPRVAHRAGRLYTDDRIIAGAGKLAGMEVSPLPMRLEADCNDGVVFWDSLKFPTASHDALTWHERLHAFDADWLSPALAALADRRISEVELYGFGDDESFAVALSSKDRFAFWRKPRRLETL